MKRGTFGFDVTETGELCPTPANVEALRRLWLDRSMIDGERLGPGDPGDFDRGAWHIGCHLVAAAGVRRSSAGAILVLEVSHARDRDAYVATVTTRMRGAVRTYPIASPDARAVLQESVLLGFIEGNSGGRISARNVQDPPERFNGSMRQDYDRPAFDSQDGGKVWEHWCTLRDITTQAHIGSSVLDAYVTLVSTLGDYFAPMVARGRREYGHPVQLCALVRAGFTSEASATHDTTPLVIPQAAESLLLLTQPAATLEAAELLQWADSPSYYMFERRITRWNPTSAVADDLRAFLR